jgi:hypothetical protein
MLWFKLVVYGLKHGFYLAFDPKPFIRSFEAAVDKLITVRKDVQTKTEQLEKTVRVAEREYSKKMADLTKGFDVSSLAVGLSTLFKI